MYKVTSEIYNETNFEPVKDKDGQTISKFRFHYSNREDVLPVNATVDKDGDLVVKRRPSVPAGIIEIAHADATEIKLVGLQVWRGALLLADFLFHHHLDLCNQQLLELGAGVGLTSIAAAIYVKQIVCTDVNIGGILELIKANVVRNQKLMTGKVRVLEYDFMQDPNSYAAELQQVIDETDIVLAADVIYDTELTDAFIRVIDSIFQSEKKSKKPKTIYIALEKRYVFTISELDAVAPMYEYFLQQTMNKSWHFENVPLDFPQYFEYERCKQLVLLKLTSGQRVL